MGDRTTKRHRVMVVDDDPIVLEVTRERLEAAGYEVILRDAGLGTSAAVLRESPDFLLLDVNMPALGGEALARMLSKTPGGAGTGVILYSGQNPSRLAKLADDCGALGAIHKTPSAESFLQQFERCVAVANGRRAVGA
jgi:CheY-like chemotaxis protein